MCNHNPLFLAIWETEKKVDSAWKGKSMTIIIGAKSWLNSPIYVLCGHDCVPLRARRGAAKWLRQLHINHLWKPLWQCVIWCECQHCIGSTKDQRQEKYYIGLHSALCYGSINLLPNPQRLGIFCLHAPFIHKQKSPDFSKMTILNAN